MAGAQWRRAGLSPAAAAPRAWMGGKHSQVPRHVLGLRDSKLGQGAFGECAILVVRLTSHVVIRFSRMAKPMLPYRAFVPLKALRCWTSNQQRSARASRHSSTTALSSRLVHGNTIGISCAYTSVSRHIFVLKSTRSNLDRLSSSSNHSLTVWSATHVAGTIGYANFPVEMQLNAWRTSCEYEWPMQSLNEHNAHGVPLYIPPCAIHVQRTTPRLDGSSYGAAPDAHRVGRRRVGYLSEP